MHKNKLNRNSKEDLNCTCKEVYDSKRGKLLTLDWNVGKQEIKVLSSWILNQHSYWKNYLTISNNHWWISFEKVSRFNVYLSTLFSFLFYFKSQVYFIFVSNLQLLKRDKGSLILLNYKAGHVKNCYINEQ